MAKQLFSLVLLRLEVSGSPFIGAETAKAPLQQWQRPFAEACPLPHQASPFGLMTLEGLKVIPPRPSIPDGLLLVSSLRM